MGEWIFHLSLWFSVANCVAGKIDRYGARLERNGRLFSEHLFQGYYAFYMVHCLDQYTKVHRSKNEKFAQAVELIFN